MKTYNKEGFTLKSKTKTIKKVLGLALSLSICASFMPGALTANAEGETVTSDYTITIPAMLTVADSGWNSIGNISATGTLASGKKLTVTASSDDKFALVSGANEVAYKLANDTEKEKTYADAAETKSWDFTALSQTPATKAIGIVVEDYSEKPAGTYQDTVTFTASVEDAKPEYYDKLTKINDNYIDQVDKLKSLGRGGESYNSSLTAAQAWELAKYQAAIDTVTVYVIMSSQGDGYEIHYSVSTDAAATEHTSGLYDICNRSNPVRMYYIAQ